MDEALREALKMLTESALAEARPFFVDNNGATYGFHPPRCRCVRCRPWVAAERTDRP